MTVTVLRTEVDKLKSTNISCLWVDTILPEGMHIEVPLSTIFSGYEPRAIENDEKELEDEHRTEAAEQIADLFEELRDLEEALFR